MLNDLDVYESGVRDKAVKFCGWHKNNQQAMGGNRGNQMSRDPTMQTYNEVKETEKSIKGGVMRAAVMAALHFEFG